MNRDELKALHDLATETRTLAHDAYKTALENRRSDGDTRSAYETLLLTNQIRDKIYAAILALALQQ